MKVFISWSGEKSKQVAELLHTWLECTIQSSKPWLSSRSIDRGALWFSEIINELADTSLGIICLTNENKNKPWILFEAGAIAKGLTSSRVCTFLIDLEPSDLENPLAQFNHTLYNKEGLEQLLHTINNLSENPIKPTIMEKVFDTYWPDFEIKFNKLLVANPSNPPKVERTKDDIMLEMLNTVRGLDKRLIGVEGTSVFTPSKQQASIMVSSRYPLRSRMISLFIGFAIKLQMEIGSWVSAELIINDFALVYLLAENIKKDLKQLFNTEVDLEEVVDAIKEYKNKSEI